MSRKYSMQGNAGPLIFILLISLGIAIALIIWALKLPEGKRMRILKLAYELKEAPGRLLT